MRLGAPFLYIIPFLFSDFLIKLQNNSPLLRSGNQNRMLAPNQYKHLQNWSPAMVAEAYACLASMWTHQHTPASWKWKWLVPIPKGHSAKVQDMRPIMLMEVLRKLWTGLIVKRITSSLQKHGVHSLIINTATFPNEARTPPIFNYSTLLKPPGMSNVPSMGAPGT